MAKFAVILPAAGKSSRFKDRDKKPFTNLDGRAVWLRTAEFFVTRDDVVQTILVLAPEDQEMFKIKFAAHLGLLGVEGRQVVLGGPHPLGHVAQDRLPAGQVLLQPAQRGGAGLPAGGRRLGQGGLVPVEGGEGVADRGGDRVEELGGRGRLGHGTGRTG